MMGDQHPPAASASPERRSVTGLSRIVVGAILLMVGTVAGFAGAVFWWSARIAGKAEREVVATATILVTKPWPGLVAVGGKESRPRETEDHVGTVQVLLKSPLVAKRAVKQGKLHLLEPFAGLEDPTIAAIQTLDVQREAKDVPVLHLSVRRPISPDDGVAILNAFIAAITEFVAENYRDRGQETLALLEKARDQLKKDLAEKEEAYREFRNNNPIGYTSKAKNKQYEDRSNALEARRTAILLRRCEIQGQINAAKKAAEDKSSRLAIQVRANLWAAKSGYQKLANAGKQEVDLVQTYMESLKEEQEDILMTLKNLDQLLESQLTAFKELSRFENENEARRAAVNRSEQLYDQVIKRLEEVNLAGDLGRYGVEVVTPPRRGGS